jgi:hypothetical protein
MPKLGLSVGNLLFRKREGGRELVRFCQAMLNHVRS